MSRIKKAVATIEKTLELLVRLCKHKLDPRPQRPDVILLFVSPSGVCKTSMATAH
jgi:hypothetical protein